MKVSIVTPVYNASATIERCVKSVTVSEEFEIEHIVVDDGSTDDTYDALIRLASAIPHLRIIRQNNAGAGAARNLAIEKATGKYIMFLDADDYWLENKLSSQIRFMEEHSVELSYGDYWIEFETGKRTLFSAPESLKYKDILTSCPIGCLTVCYNRESLGRVYMPNLRQGQDWATWLLILRKGVVATKYPGILAVYTVNSNSLSSNKFKKALNIFNIYRDVIGEGVLKSFLYTLIHSVKVLRARKRG
ncbi:glycosyl transferase [Aliidiomarina sedimenti]|uniref:Glycosyl transferase n=1 Tax=Aliidiomarina sedimenti TaxID=1933879 RepID=A0ABY0BZ27_9GAMM|nr:glycosyltransferase family 2 protein [Aliidiomarina sedimenti]RUO30015.1 glycosyl transferase [Aliidiomarina sedimenti]